VAVRGGKGVLIAADEQTRAGGQQLDMQPAQALLEQALAQMQALSDAALASQAHGAEVARQKALLEDTLKGLKSAGVLVSAPAGMGLVSGMTCKPAREATSLRRRAVTATLAY
jgi:type VI secretion system secreted protein VgrG